MKHVKPKAIITALLITALLSGCQNQTAPASGTSDSGQVSQTSGQSTVYDSSETSSIPDSDVDGSTVDSNSSVPDEKIEFKLYDDMQSIESWNSAAAFSSVLPDGAVINAEQYDYLLEQTFGDKLITDGKITERVNTLITVHNKLSKELWTASYSPVGTDPHGISKDEKDNWFESSEAPQSFSSMQELYELEKDTYNDITTFEDFSEKFDCFKFEDGKFYMKGHTFGRTDTFKGAFDFSGLDSATVCDYAAAVSTDDGIKLAYIIDNVPNGKTHYFFICLADLQEADGQYKIARDCDWENAFGKGGK